VMNLSLSRNPPSNTDGSDEFDRVLDWAAEQGVNITIAAGNLNATRDASGEVVLNESPGRVRSPGSAYNVVTVGRTGVPVGDPNSGPINDSTVLTYDQVMSTSAVGPISSPAGANTRDKPDLVAPGTYITVANSEFIQNVASTYWTKGLNGT